MPQQEKTVYVIMRQSPDNENVQVKSENSLMGGQHCNFSPKGGKRVARSVAQLEAVSNNAESVN
jgi:hypothetical protein